MLAEILPASVAVAEAVGPWPSGAEPAGAWPGGAEPTLLPEEEAALGEVAEVRRRDFTLARTCARRALAQLGLPPTPILPGPKRQPLWPVGVVGSITHCPGYCAAAVAERERLASVGIDAEPHEALPDGVLELVTLAEERAWLQAAPAAFRWDRLLFSAKESVYKAWFPLAGRWLGFEDALVTVDPGADPAGGRFRARLLVSGPVVAGRAVAAFDGRYLVRDGLVLTAVTVG